MKVFVSGVSGLLGLNYALAASQAGDEVLGCYLAHPVEAPGMQLRRMDVTRLAEWDRHVIPERPELIVNAAGLTNVDRCEREPGLALELNVLAAKNAAITASRLGARLIHVSTDHLFDGTLPMRSELDPPAPLNTYARTKLEAEGVVVDANPNALVVRTNFYGWGTSVRRSFSDWILGGLRSGQPLTLFEDSHFTPILVNDLVDIATRALEAGARGVVNIAGSQRLSKYEFGLAMAREFGLASDSIVPTSIAHARLTAPRPPDMSLSTERVTALLGERPPDAAEGIARLRRLGEQAWPKEIEACTRSDRPL